MNASRTTDEQDAVEPSRLETLFHAVRAWALNYPALLLCALLLGVMLPFVRDGSCAWGTLLVSALCASCFFAALCTRYHGAAAGIVFAAALFFNFYVQTPGRAHYTHLFGPAGGAVQVHCVVEDMLMPSDACRAFMPNPYWITCRMTACSQAPDAPLTPCEGQFVLILPLADSDFALQYGQSLAVDGALRYAQTPLDARQFDSRAYLKNKGMPMILYADTVRNAACAAPLGVVQRVFAAVLPLRDKLMFAMCRGLDDEGQRLTSALIFGFKQGLDSERKQDLIRAGLIHLFAVSGLHMAFFAMIVYVFLLLLPLRYRAGVLFAGLTLYAIATGLQISCLRALLMMGIFILFRSSLRRTISINTLALSALVLMTYDMRCVFDIGFLYSYAATAFLILGYGAYVHLCSLRREKCFWMPLRVRRRARPVLTPLRAKGETMLLSSACALSATAPISAYAMGFFPLSALLLNIVVLPLIFLVFVMSFLKVMLPFLNTICAFGITTIFELTTLLSREASENISHLSIAGDMPFFSAFFVWGGLIVLTCGRKFRYYCAALLLITCAFIPGCYERAHAPGKLLVVYGARSDLVFVARINPDGRSVDVIGSGPTFLSEGLQRRLAAFGIDRIENWILPSGRAIHLHGAQKMLETFPVAHSVQLSPEARLLGNYKTLRALLKQRNIPHVQQDTPLFLTPNAAYAYDNRHLTITDSALHRRVELNFERPDALEIQTGTHSVTYPLQSEARLIEL